jgi:ribosomal protein S18 acetylase RimI-like enzyme
MDQMSTGAGDAGQAPEAANEAAVVIREMTIEDYAAVVGLWEEAGLTYRPGGRDRAEKIRAELTQGTALFLVAEVKGRIVGVVLGTHDGRRGWVNRLAVAPAHRRRGIAAGLVREVERRAKALGIDIVAALIESENQTSLRFFEAIDYVHSPAIEYVSKRSSPDT